VERLTTGRRHIRAGSVHVTDLIGKPPVELPDPRSPEAGQPDSGGALDTLLERSSEGPTSHRRPPSKGAQLAKIAGLGLGAFVLCASVVYGSMITGRRDGPPAQAGARPAAQISGEEALLPDLLNQVVPSPDATGEPRLPHAPTQATGRIDNTGAPTVPAGPPAPEAPAAGPAASDESLSKIELVQRFYELVPTAPNQAFTLLDSTLLGTDLGEFVRSWTSVSDIQLLDVQPRGDDVLAIVRLHLADGSYLRVQQLLEVANTVPRRIVGAEILSAQRN
jgi:hypothetical protein